ncbi:hypothetical protein NDU88_002337 [Pleurodeles waltl]|uniref:Uncharacterized protein n=1 Tax=Pleurodeles waltl TaxID=8319 RepID=A0AAV7M0L8_PLEWA|nr:hypothetical protein NDU88_002337 [Pleurodeles waltl]
MDADYRTGNPAVRSDTTLGPAGGGEGLDLLLAHRALALRCRCSCSTECHGGRITHLYPVVSRQVQSGTMHTHSLGALGGPWSHLGGLTCSSHGHS